MKYRTEVDRYLNNVAIVSGSDRYRLAPILSIVMRSLVISISSNRGWL